MRKTTATVFLSLVLTVVMASLCYAGPVDKARDFMKAGMHKQAEALLEQEINQNPTNAEAHFLLGKCYILLDEFRSFPKAEKRFSSAVKLDPSGYAREIANVYIDVGLEQLARANKRKALDLLSEARKYDSRSGDEIARRCFKKGEELLRYGEYAQADGYFFVAARYDSSLKSDIARIYYRQYRAEGKLPLLKQASRYNQSEYGQEYARASLENGMNVSSSEWEERTKEAQKYLSNREILQLSVDYYARKWGEPKELKLSPGEWIKDPRVYEGSKFHYLANKEYWLKTTAMAEDKKIKSRKKIREEHWYSFSDLGQEKEFLEFKAIRPNTVIYYWMEH